MVTSHIGLFYQSEALSVELALHYSILYLLPIFIKMGP